MDIDLKTVEESQNIESENTETPTEEATPTEETSPKQEETLTPEETIEKWEQDKRFESSWKKDPNRLYKNYRDMEKTYNPLKSQLETYNGLFEKYGIEADKLEDGIKEYRELKNPDRLENKYANYLKEFLEDPSFRQDVFEYFEDLEKRKIQQKYGDMIPKEIVNQLEGLQKWKADKESAEEKARFEEATEKAKATINEQSKQNEEYAKKWGIVYDDATHNQLLAYCNENEIEPKYFHRVFKDLAEEKVEAIQKKRVEEDVVKRLGNNKKAGIITAPKSPEPKGKTGSRRDNLKPLVNKLLGK